MHMLRNLDAGIDVDVAKEAAVKTNIGVETSDNKWSTVDANTPLAYNVYELRVERDGSIMLVRQEGDGGFDMEPAGPAEQGIADTEITERLVAEDVVPAGATEGEKETKPVDP
ncbi:uncharacterized protein [Ptychodera flava]|uniref:uncharacterized protein n=1 Tax=Ptychodera flava TaxID=63121 RepID=UPI00396A4120